MTQVIVARLSQQAERAIKEQKNNPPQAAEENFNRNDEPDYR